MVATSPYMTFGQLRAALVKGAGLVDGSAVQTYTEPQANEAIQTMFDFLMGKQSWSHITGWQTWTLDGITGTVTNDISAVRRYEDIHEFKWSNTDHKIMEPTGTQHLYATGTTPAYRTRVIWNDPLAAKLVKFWPINSTGSVDVLVSTIPEPFVDDDDVVPFDPVVMKLGALWYLLADNGLNPGAGQKAQSLFDIAYRDYVSNQGSTDIGYGATYYNDTFSLR